MKTVCEIVVKDILPATRALIAKELLETHHMTQQEAAKRMGVTQPAISQYKRELRGFQVKILEGNEKTMDYIEEVAADLANREIESSDLTDEYYNILDIIMGEGLIHKIGEDVDHSIKKCGLCS